MDEKDVKMMLMMGALMGVSSNASMTPEQIAARANDISEKAMVLYRKSIAKSTEIPPPPPPFTYTEEESPNGH